MSNSAFVTCEYEHIIEKEVSNLDLKNKINHLISKNEKSKHLDKNSILNTLRNEGVIDCILESLLSKSKHISLGENPITDQILLSNVRPSLSPPGPGQFLGINIVKGINFSEHLLVDTSSANDRFEYELRDPSAMSNCFQLFLSYQKQRISSQLIPCLRNPLINQQFFIKITDGNPDNTSVSSLLGLREPIHVVLIKHNLMTKERFLISSQVFEWRMVLCSESWTIRINLDFQGVFDECKVNVGSLEIILQLVPENNHEPPIAEDIFNEQLRMENVSYGSEKERKFLLYAKQWWHEFSLDHPRLQSEDNNDERRVKIFAQDENGLNRFVCDYVSPVRAGRILDSPSQAARFVASIPIQPCMTIGSNSTNHDQWKSGLAFLVENRGNAENHAVLLCSLLLGFGINAYVAVGSVKDEKSDCRSHTWVVSFQEEHPNKATFWEACTGKKFHFKSFPHYNPPKNGKIEYLRIGCLFNHFRYFANSYKTTNIEMCVFDLTNAARWKPMSEDVIATVVDNRFFEKTIQNNGLNNISWNNRIPLFVSRLVSFSDDPIKISNDLEHQIRSLITNWRSAKLGSNIVTRWDDQLCYILGQALFSYEQEQLTGIPNLGNDEFKAAIQRHVVEGYTFKAFPLHVLHINAKHILDTALRSSIFQEIISCIGSDVKLSLRVRVFGYAEYSTPTWVIFGCTYQFHQG